MSKQNKKDIPPANKKEDVQKFAEDILLDAIAGKKETSQVGAVSEK